MTMRMQGADELARKLREIPDKAQKLCVDAMKAEARPMLDEMKRTAPEDTGRLRFFLAMSGSTRKGRARVLLGCLRMSKQKLAKNSKKLAGQGPFYARFTEFGTEFQPAQNWMKDAADKEAQGFLDRYPQRLGDKLGKEMAKRAH
ncbi:MAG: HK97 gp10 family phage protein [Candidatus Obscuribacterales bacterium]|nr:HK97 gp10 family phage protein [Candidatus Obscuribacterales bacterium]